MVVEKLRCIRSYFACNSVSRSCDFTNKGIKYIIIIIRTIITIINIFEERLHLKVIMKFLKYFSFPHKKHAYVNQTGQVMHGVVSIMSIYFTDII